MEVTTTQHLPADSITSIWSAMWPPHATTRSRICSNPSCTLCSHLSWENDAATTAAILATQLEDLEELNGNKDDDANGVITTQHLPAISSPYVTIRSQFCSANRLRITRSCRQFLRHLCQNLMYSTERNARWKNRKAVWELESALK